MSLIRLDKVSKSFMGAEVLEQIDFRVETGEKVGLVGRNGTGKSTIFRLITGETPPDSGTIERMRRARIATLAQIPNVSSDTPLMSIVMDQFQDLVAMEERLRDLEQRMAEGDENALEAYSPLQDEFTIRGGYEFRANAERVLTGLGFREFEFELPFKSLSGGQRTRLMLALVLLEDADLLLLDEPENHLDLAAREWLESFLKEWERAFVIISHDRQMLNEVVGRVVEVERGQLFSYVGNYDDYLKGKALVREQQEKAFQRQQEFIEKEESWINRFRYKATKAKQVQSRVKRLEKMERVEAPPPEASMVTFKLGEVVRSGAVVMDAKELSMAYDALELYSGVTFQVERGERVGIIGPNGTGKSTLLRQLAGRLELGSGEVSLGHKVKLGYYDQQHEDLNVANDILTEIRNSRPDMTPEQVRTFMGKFLFTGEDIFKAIGTLSGGERSRVATAKLILSEANLLLLDEPTNHLDIASREALEGALMEFPGSIVMVSHDRVLIDKLVDKLVIVSEGTAEVYLGNYSHYRWKMAAEKAADRSEQSARDAMKIRTSTKGKQDFKNKKADERAQRKQKRRLDDLETGIQEMEELIEDYEARFNQIDPADHEKLSELTEEYEALRADLREMYSEWDALAEEVSG